jgi:hypothetical protein
MSNAKTYQGSCFCGAENIDTYNKTKNSNRKCCKTSGRHDFTERPSRGLKDVYVAVIPQFPYKAGVHLHYRETKLRIKDGLPTRIDSVCNSKS